MLIAKGRHFAKQRWEFTSTRLMYSLVTLGLLTVQSQCLGQNSGENGAHPEKISPISSQLKAGISFDEKHLRNERSDDWIQIPNWLAGKWRSISLVRISRYIVSSEKLDEHSLTLSERLQETLGYQKDSSGNVWTLKSPFEPIVYHSAQNGHEGKPPDLPITIYLLREYSELRVHGDRVTLRTVDTRVSVQEKANLIEGSERSENFRNITAIDEGLIAVLDESQSYDDQGLPLERKKTIELWLRETPFRTINDIGRVNVYASFKKFLQSSGRTILIPSREQQ
jgi:hypothetical protein